MARPPLTGHVAEDRRRDAYVALREWQRRTGRSLEWEQVLFPEEVLEWASNEPEVARMLRGRY